jgi:hypothetical protein
MQVTITRSQALFAITAVSCLVAVSVALAAPTDTRAPRATTSASVTKQIKKLKRRIAALEARSGVPGAQGAQGAQGPPGPSTGVAGGALTGNYPNPLIAANGVGSNEVLDDSLTSNDLGPNSVGTSEVLNDSLSAADIANVDFLRAGTARLTDSVGGAAAGQLLFTIGRVGLSAFCSNEGGGSMRAGISPVLQPGDTGTIRPVMVTDGQGGSADDDVALVLFDVQFFTILTSSSVAAQEASFAILDSQNTTASGVVAASVNPANSSCVLTAHAVG